MGGLVSEGRMTDLSGRQNQPTLASLGWGTRLYTPPMERPYWVFEWFDVAGVQTERDIIKAMSDDETMRELRRAARANEAHARAALPSGVRILAGRGLDLSGELDCWALDLRLRQVERLLSRVWLYFDFVVVADWITPELASESFTPDRHGRERLVSDLLLLLRIWQSGAAPFLIFRRKPGVCKEHWPEKIKEFGLDSLRLQAFNLVPEVAETSDIAIEPCDCEREGCTQFTLNNSMFEHTVWGGFFREGTKNSDFRLASAEATVQRYFDHLVAIYGLVNTMEQVWAARYEVITGSSPGNETDGNQRLSRLTSPS